MLLWSAYFSFFSSPLNLVLLSTTPATTVGGCCVLHVAILYRKISWESIGPDCFAFYTFSTSTALVSVSALSFSQSLDHKIVARRGLTQALEHDSHTSGRPFGIAFSARNMPLRYNINCSYISHLSDKLQSFQSSSTFARGTTSGSLFTEDTCLKGTDS